MSRITYLNDCIPMLVNIESAQIISKNFSGNKFSEGGAKNFCVVIDDDVAQMMNDDGWNVRIHEPIDPNDRPYYFLPVEVRFDIVPPSVYRYSPITKRKVVMTDQTIGTFDHQKFKNVDLIIRSHKCKDGHLKAYVQEMHVLIEESVFAEKYADYDFSDTPEEIPFC